MSIYENMDYFQIMLFTVTCLKFQKIQQPYIKRYFYVLFSTNIVEILLKLWADASSGSGAVKVFLQGSSSPSPSPSPSPSSSLLYPPYPKDQGMLWFYVEAARRPPPAARHPPPAARHPPPAARHPPPAARNGVNAITQKPLDGLFSNLVYTLVVIVSWPD